MAGKRAAWSLHLLCRARQPQSGLNVPGSGHPALAEGAPAPQSAPPPELGADEPPGGPMAPTGPNPASLPGGTLCRSNLRQEPSAGIPHAGICAGGRPQGRSLPQPAASTSRCCTPSCGASTNIWCAGPAGNTNGCAGAKGERKNSWPGQQYASRPCSLTGASASNPTAGRWEPCKPRGFRTVLRAAGGEIPPADSPCATSATGGCDVEDRADGCGVVLVMEAGPPQPPC